MTFKERYEQCQSKFRGVDIGMMNIILYMYIPIICYGYAIVTSFEFLVFFVLLMIYYI